MSGVVARVERALLGAVMAILVTLLERRMRRAIERQR